MPAAASAQAMCQARQRLPLAVLLQLVEHGCAAACSGAADTAAADTAAAGKAGLWHGLRVFLADGMSVLAPDTPLRARYGAGSNQHGAVALTRCPSC
ncbi:MAG TPA: hypothetical protein VFB66_04100 [Tepidisphaeraceae bacterium]|nr:hypothetical protein [Tepidisphaeraceae bacterium]